MAQFPTARRRFDPGAVLGLSLFAGTWTWWALVDGAYYGKVLYPGIGLLVAGFCVLLWAAPWRASLLLSGPVRLAIGALVALAAWTLASALWTPSPEVAVMDAQRVLAYALVFGLGLWVCNLLSHRMELALAPVVIAAGIILVALFAGMATGDQPSRYLYPDGTPDYPLGYRNANAAFFMLALWPALGMASSTALSRPVRLAALAVATGCIEVGLLSQSRGAIVAGLVALVVFVLSMPSRPRALAWLALAALPALVCLPAAAALYDAARDFSLDGTADEMHAAGWTAALGVALALGLGVVATALEGRVKAPEAPGWVRDRSPLQLWAGVACIAVIAILVVIGNPVTWAGDRIDEFRAGEPDRTGQTSRITSVGSNRSDLWRVALNAASEDPLFGDGAGGYHYRYMQERDDPKVARDAHSVELEMLSELGIPGLALFVAAIGAMFAGVLRARRLGPSAATLGAAALAAGAYWLTHASLDWFWPYPAITAPALGLLGAACAPALLVPSRVYAPAVSRVALAIAAGVLAVSVVAPYLSERYVDAAYTGYQNDLAKAYKDLDRAQSLNSLGDAPLLAEGAIARRAGDRERALSAFRAAAAKRPEEWGGHYFLALLYAQDQTSLARSELAVVEELNPLAPEIEQLRARIAAAAARATSPG